MKLELIDKQFNYDSSRNLESAIYLFLDKELNVLVKMYLKLEMIDDVITNLVDEFIGYFSEIKLPKHTLININLVKNLNDIKLKIDSNIEKFNFNSEIPLFTSKVVLHYLKYWIDSLEYVKPNDESITVDINWQTVEEITGKRCSYLTSWLRP